MKYTISFYLREEQRVPEPRGRIRRLMWRKLGVPTTVERWARHVHTVDGITAEEAVAAAESLPLLFGGDVRMVQVEPNYPGTQYIPTIGGGEALAIEPMGRTNLFRNSERGGFSRRSYAHYLDEDGSTLDTDGSIVTSAIPVEVVDHTKTRP